MPPCDEDVVAAALGLLSISSEEKAVEPSSSDTTKESLSSRTLVKPPPSVSSTGVHSRNISSSIATLFCDEPSIATISVPMPQAESNIELRSTSPVAQPDTDSDRTLSLDGLTPESAASPVPDIRGPHELNTNSILTNFKHGRIDWLIAHNNAMNRNRAFCKEISERAAYIVELRRKHVPELNLRAIIMQKSTIQVQEAYMKNWRDWNAYIGYVESMMKAGQKMINWLELLAKEYAAMEELWEKYWNGFEKIVSSEMGDLNSEPSGSERTVRNIQLGDELCNRIDQELAEPIIRLGSHNFRRAWLHRQIVEENEGMWMRAFFGEGEPEWLDW